MQRKSFFFKLSILISLSYWFFDSAIHYFWYGELEFEIIPSDFNELWMRSAIFILLLAFGVFADYKTSKIIKAYKKKEELQKRLEDALSKKLSEFIPICANCKKIRLEDSKPEIKDSWVHIESYISKKTSSKFTHGFCPECKTLLYGDILNNDHLTNV